MFLASLIRGDRNGARRNRSIYKEVHLIMSKKFTATLSVFALISIFSITSIAQETTTQVVKNADGTYTVIEYPVGKEVSVTLRPSSTLTGARGAARVMRSADGTKVWLDLSGVPA